MLSSIGFLLSVLSLAPQAKLAILRPALHQYEDGPALPSDFRFTRGETVFLSFRIQGYKVSPESRISLRCRIDVVDPRGIPVAETAHKELDAELAPEDKDWMPVIRHTFALPPLGEPGTYRVLIAAEDKLAGAQASVEVPFTVRGPVVEPSDTLVPRNFRFLRREDSRDVVDPPVFHPGEMLWARFEITGYKIGEKNRINVEYGLSVLTASGKAIYTEPRAAVEDSSPFYPNRYLPGVLSLNLEKARPGEYTIVLMLRDKVGNQEHESRHPFKVQ